MVPKIYLRLSVIAALLAAYSSVSGIFDGKTYSREAPGWAAEGVGQDIANLFIAVPALVICFHYLARGSVRALFVWLGTLIYLLYAYVLYGLYFSASVLKGVTGRIT